ncbi:MAG: sugar ABC transporter permease [Deltaproteobacteria bacterium]|nr:sugar ABC transporter permease [Deltaproteobacteria bacterium]
MRPRGREILAVAATNLFLAVFTLLTLTPLLYVLKLAFSGDRKGLATLSLLPSSPTLDNFIAVVTRSERGEWVFGHHLLNSIVISAATTVLGIVLACTAAYAFSRFKFPGRRAGLLSFLVSQMFPGILMMIPLYVVMQKLGLLNRQVGLILVYSTTAIPFCVWMLKGYFDTIPKDLEESAVIDGAGKFLIFWKIMLPLAAPAIAVTALFSFMTAWNEFLLAYTFMTDPLAYTLPVEIQKYVGEEIQWELFAAASVLVSIPVMALFFALQKNLVGGLTAGSVKG